MARPAGLNYKGKFHVIERHGEFLLVIFKNDRPQDRDIVNGDYLVVNRDKTRSSLYRLKKKIELEFYFWKKIFDFLKK